MTEDWFRRTSPLDEQEDARQKVYLKVRASLSLAIKAARTPYGERVLGNSDVEYLVTAIERLIEIKIQSALADGEGKR